MNLDHLTEEELNMYLLLKREKIIEDAQNDFYEFCKVLYPSFYKPNRTFLKTICNTLQDFIEDKLINPTTNEPYQNLTLNVPPRHGKSFTIKNLEMWLLGKNNKRQIITVSYSRDLADLFAQQVRDGIDVEASDDLNITYADIFPDTKLKYGDSSKRKWSLEGSERPNYYATSIGSAITGMGATVGVIDDPTKDDSEAFNEDALEKILNWYDNTFASRIEKGGKTILIMTRWSTNDLTGRLLERESSDWYELKLAACLNEQTGEMLCDEIFDIKMYQKRKRTMSPEIFMSNYQQEPIKLTGRLYTHFKTYKKIPVNEHDRPVFTKVIGFVDYADKGKDWTCCVISGVFNNELYILDVLYSQESSDKTEYKLAEIIHKNEVNEVTFEGNAAGSVIARNVEKILRSQFNNHLTTIKTFHQSKNKESRILSMSSTVERLVYFPSNWNDRWNKFYLALISFQRIFKNNKHDDAPDALTGLVELIESGGKPIRAVKSLYSYLKG
ncbi:phage terminase large subunit [Lysinibacillus sp. NPDC097214]|uniref:phage terminase large subunit n=1 Tax=Lysinibacillus sp. NPDC097214 TaxID=3390584 RepID=UPI003D009363